MLIRAAVWLAGYAPWEGDEEKREFSDLFCAISTVSEASYLYQG